MLDQHTLKVDDTKFSAAEMAADLQPKRGARRLNPDGEYGINATLGSLGIFVANNGDRKIHIQSSITSIVRVPELNGWDATSLLGRKVGDFPRLNNEIDRRRLRQLLVGQGYNNADIDSLARLEEALTHLFQSYANGVDASFYTQWGAYDKNSIVAKPAQGDKEGWKEYNAAKNINGMKNFQKDPVTNLYSSTYIFTATGTEAEANESVKSYGPPVGGATKGVGA